jgi:hypothetical protein
LQPPQGGYSHLRNRPVLQRCYGGQ